MERLVRKQLVKHMEDNDILDPHQHGFTQRKSCLTNLLESLENWTNTLDKGHNLDIIFLDFQKAFDMVPHKRLIKKLSAYGIQGKLLKWLEDFLTGRSQQVAVGSGLSSWGSVSSGVPQGSVLGPVLFLLYVNELPKLVSSQIMMFADDTKMYRAIRDNADHKALQEDLATLEQWNRDWLLRFNTEKCKVMYCGPSNPKRSYDMEALSGERENLEESCSEKDLGIHIVNSLKPTFHCKKAANKAMSSQTPQECI